MRTASLVLGIVGGAITTLISFFLLSGSAAMLNADFADPSAKAGGIAFAIWGGIVLIGGVLGIVGGAMVRRRHILSGVLMIVAAVFSFISMIGFLTGIILLIAGIFAFINDTPRLQQSYDSRQMPPNYAPYPPQNAPASIPVPTQPAPAIPASPQTAPSDAPSQTATVNIPASTPEELDDPQRES